MMKITVNKLRGIIKEEVKKSFMPFEAVILQDRDEFTDMMGGGSYYSDLGWPDEGDDANVKAYAFDSEMEARNFAMSKLKDLDVDDPNGVMYRAIIFKIGPRGKKTFIDELKID